MSDITLSASIRANLLSLQNTAQMMETTQNRLATGKKVNSALDNPISFFTASGLDSRANDISNLLDGISNGVQVIQAANTGITSLTSLVTTAKSIAQQALQVPIGYSSKSNVSATIGGATSNDLRGTTTYTSATASSNVLFNGAAGGTSAANGTTTLGGTIGTLTGTSINASTNATSLLNGTASAGDANAGVAAGDVITVNGKTITFQSGDAPGTAPSGFTKLNAAAGKTSGNVYTDASGDSIVYLGSATKAMVGDVLSAIDIASGVQRNNAGALTANAGQTPSAVTAGALVLKSSTGADLSITGRADVLNALKLTTATGSGNATVGVARTTSSASLANLITDGSTLSVNGKTITFKNAVTPGSSDVPAGSGVDNNVVTDGNGNSTVYLESGKINDVLEAIDLATGVRTASNSGGTATVSTASGQTNSTIAGTGALQISTGIASDLTITGTGNTLAALGLNGSTGTSTSFTAGRSAGAGSISGKTLNFSSFQGGTAVSITFGDGTAGTVKTLDQLNAALADNNMTASIDSTGKLTVTTTNDYASSTLGGTAGGVISGTITAALSWSTASAPVADANSMNTRASLVSQYNNIMSQINTTAQDASFNGVNLLNGDQLKLTFNETGTSTLSMTGVNFDAGGLGLSNLTSGTDFIDNNATNKVLAVLDAASTQLRTQASTFGSNLSVVQTRQDFNKNLVNVLQTGSSNLTLADTNEEGANLLALQTRQSLSTTALSMAAQADQNVLRLFG